MHLNTKDIEGFKHGDFIKFKRNQMVYNTKGLPMYRDVEQYGWLKSSVTHNGKVHIQSTHDHGVMGNMLYLPVDNIISKASWNGNTKDYPRTTCSGFTVTKPVFEKQEGSVIMTYAGGDIPLPRSAQATARMTNAKLEKAIKKQAKATGRKYEVRYKKKEDSLDQEIQKQKEMINGKVKG